MALNNTKSISSNNRNLQRMNRLSENMSTSTSTFDNPGFEHDNDRCGDWINPPFHIEETYPQQEKRKNPDENKTTTPRRMLPSDPTMQTRGSRTDQADSTVSNPKATQHNSFELNPLDGKSQNENRKVLGSISHVSDSSNTPNSESKDNDFTDSKYAKNGKASKMTFNVNLKRFEATAATNNKNNTTDSQDRLKLSRQVKTEDLSINRRRSDVYGVVVAASRFSRSSSMRNPRKPPRLLRDISFSDADDTATMDYGSLKRMNLPRRLDKGPISVDTVVVLESLMRELIDRGKIYHVAVLDLEESDVLASVPSGMFTKTDALGMTKSIICQSSLFRLQIGEVSYSCFKHRQDAVQGRNEELVMVMQTTQSCVVVGFSREDCPGSCNSEVNEFAKVLEEAGW